MKNRVVIFAHYSKNNVIENYVICYLEGLKQIANTIIFVSDSDLPEAELQKIQHLAHFSVAERHGEYDFGSYKRGFQIGIRQQLFGDCEELVFCNDSCYAPLRPFGEMFDCMAEKTVDFWGASENPQGLALVSGQYITGKIKHVQSFFIVFRKQIFLNDFFASFLDGVKKEDSKEAIICNYEVGLSRKLIEHGFKYDVYSNHSKTVNNSDIFHFDQLIKQDRFPLLKRNIVLRAVPAVYPLGLKRLITRYTEYDYRLIEDDVRKNLHTPNSWTKYKIFKFFFRRLRHRCLKRYFNINKENCL